MNTISQGKRLSYAATDTAGQLVFAVISTYLLYFYTDVYGIPVGIAGTILLVARCIDGIDAPVWGMILDESRSRWGKYRPWFLWLCGPYAVFGVLTFLTPDLSAHAKVWYSAATYIVCGILYTGINTPVTAILSALTPDPSQRVMLTTYRMIGSKVGVLIVNATVLPLVALLGHGNDKRGFMLTMPIFAAGAVITVSAGVPQSRGSRRGTQRTLGGYWVRLARSRATGLGSSSPQARSSFGSHTSPEYRP